MIKEAAGSAEIAVCYCREPRGPEQAGRVGQDEGSQPLTVHSYPALSMSPSPMREMGHLLRTAGSTCLLEVTSKDEWGPP